MKKQVMAQAPGIKTSDAPQILLSLKVVVIGLNHCWGAGDTLPEALKNACNPKEYCAYICHPDFEIGDLDGTIYSPAGYQAKRIVEKVSAATRARALVK